MSHHRDPSHIAVPSQDRLQEELGTDVRMDRTVGDKQSVTVIVGGGGIVAADALLMLLNVEKCFVADWRTRDTLGVFRRWKSQSHGKVAFDAM